MPLTDQLKSLAFFHTSYAIGTDGKLKIASVSAVSLADIDRIESLMKCEQCMRFAICPIQKVVEDKNFWCKSWRNK